MARKQIEAERVATTVTAGTSGSASAQDGPAGDETYATTTFHTASGGIPAPGPKPVPKPTRFHGSVTLDAACIGHDASRIADEVLAHLTGLVGAKVM